MIIPFPTAFRDIVVVLCQNACAFLKSGIQLVLSEFTKTKIDKISTCSSPTPQQNILSPCPHYAGMGFDGFMKKYYAEAIIYKENT